MPLKSPQDLLALELKEIHSAERQLSRALPKMKKVVSSEELGALLDRRREQAAQLIEAIDESLEEMGTTKGRVKNVAIEGLIEDVNQHADDIQNPAMLQAAVVGSVQKIEHYCIAAWGTAASLGRLFEQEKAVTAMEQALEEGKQLDQELTQLAESEINPAMLSEASEEGEGAQSRRSGRSSSEEEKGERQQTKAQREEAKAEKEDAAAEGEGSDKGSGSGGSRRKSAA